MDKNKEKLSEQLILIKYGELSTKKGNRKLFIQILAKNIKSILKDYEVKIKFDYARMYLIINPNDIEEVILKLKKVFGIQSIVSCFKVNTNSEEIKDKILELLKTVTFDKYKTFKIVTRRVDKEFKFNSMEFNNIIGGLVLKNSPLLVDIHNPDLKITIEIRPLETHIYFNEIKGLGGYPVGVQGKGLLMLSGGIDSPVAGYLALKRGIDLECVYFESLPHTSIMARNKVIKLVNIINEYSGNIKLHIVPFTKLQEAIYKNIDDRYAITIMRRMMYRIAIKLLKKYDCKVVINGESVGQVASQTLDSMIVINDVTNIPIIRPVACLDKLEIIELAQKVGTYETSILPYEDCCTIFVPKHPVIHPRLSKCLEYEQRFDYESLINECLDRVVTVNLLTESFEELL